MMVILYDVVSQDIILIESHINYDKVFQNLLTKINFLFVFIIHYLFILISLDSMNCIIHNKIKAYVCLKYYTFEVAQ